VAALQWDVCCSLLLYLSFTPHDRPLCMLRQAAQYQAMFWPRHLQEEE
jgi:hypothetical protein